MLLPSLFTLASVALAAQPAQLYISSVRSSVGPTSLTGAQANAVIAHHLGVAQYEHLPGSSHRGQGNWQDALGEDAFGSGQKVVVIVECGSGGCGDVIPHQFEGVQAFELPSLPELSWASLVSLHLHRLASSLGYDPQDKQAFPGLDRMVESIKSVAGWAGWVGDELGSRIGWNQLERKFKATVMPSRPASGLLGDLDLLDPSAQTLINDLQSLATLVDYDFTASTQAVALRLSGLKDVAKAHSPSSAEYHRAAALLKATLSATLASIQASAPAEPTVLLLALPPYSPPLLRKRTQWLAPFANVHSRFARAGPAVNLAKRGTPEEGRVDAAVLRRRAAEASSTPVVPQSKTCFASLRDLNNQTASCLGHGEGVKGITTRGTTCWVCQCTKTVDDAGHTTKWAGEGCEKEDLSGDFTLLFFSGAGLVLVLAFSVGVLYSVGNVELPGTLSSVGGNGGAKKD